MEQTHTTGKKGLRTERDWTKGSISKNLMSLSWPMMISSTADMIGPTIDLVWVGRLGAGALAGVGASSLIVTLIHSTILGLHIGTRAMVARFIGAGDTRGAIHAAQQSLIITIFVSLLVALVGIFFADQILLAMGVAPDVVAEGAPYLRIKFASVLTFATRRMTETTMQASGDAVKPMWIAMFYRFLHVALCPFLVFGWWIFPRLEVNGAAISNVICQGLGGVIGFWLLFSGRTRLKLDLKGFRIDLNMIWRQIKLGLPASFTGMERSLGGIVMMWFISPYGTLAIASHSVNQRLDTILMVPAGGMGQAAGVLAGQNLGAKQPERAERTGNIAAGILTAAIIVASIIFVIFAESIVRIFSSDPGVIMISSTFLRIDAIGYLVMGLNSAYQQVMNSAGDTFPPMLIGLVNMWLIQVPLAYFLPHAGLGVNGVRWAMLIGTAVAAAVYVIYYKSGRWKHKKV